jgi:hypothetical protein
VCFFNLEVAYPGGVPVPCGKGYFLTFGLDVHLAANKDHGSGGRHEARLIDAMPLLLFDDAGGDIGAQIVVRSSFTEKRPQVVVILAEKAGPKLAVGSEPDARAVAAERLGDRGDKADFSGGAIGKTVFPRSFTPFVGDLGEGPAGVNAVMNLDSGNDKRTIPMAVRVQRHELNKAHDDAGVAGEPGKGLDFVIIEAADEHSVDLGGRKGRFLGDINAVHDRGEGLGARDAFELDGVEGVEADVDALQACGDEPIATFRKELAVGGHREVLNAEVAEAGKETFDTVADKGFAAGDADFANAEADKNLCEPIKLRPGENLVVIAIVLRVGRTAVNASEIAAVRDGDAQVCDLAAEFVVEGHVHLLPRGASSLGCSRLTC